MRFKKFYFTVAALLLSAVAVVAQQQLAPSAENLQKHVSYLASDALDGRRTGTAGANDAARYIEGEFSRLGLMPGSMGQSDRPNKLIFKYLQSFPYVGDVALGKANTLTVVNKVGSDDLKVGSDWIPLAFSSTQRIENGEIVFAGFGITASELNYNDYSSKHNKNQIAVIFAGTPDGDNIHGSFARYAETRFKVTAAKNAGVGALLIIAREADLKDSSWVRLRYDHGGEAGIPVAVISRNAAAKILAQPDKPLASYEEAADKRKSEQPAPTQTPGSGEARLGSTITIEQLNRVAPADRSLTLSTNVVRTEVPAYNVIGALEGSDPVLRKEYIIIGAHYDHLGCGGEGSGSLAGDLLNSNTLSVLGQDQAIDRADIEHSQVGYNFGNTTRPSQGESAIYRVLE